MKFTLYPMARNSLLPVFLFLLSVEAICAMASTQDLTVLEIRGTINPGSASYFMDNLSKAQAQGKVAVVLTLNTPGGLLSSTRDMMEAMAGSKIPVVIFIGPGGARATSAGALLSLAAHKVFMAPGTNMGAAHPVGAGGEEVKGAMGEKVTSDTSALARSFAILRQRNPDLADQIVTKSRSFSAEEALKEGLADGVADSLVTVLSLLKNKKIPMGPASEEFQWPQNEYSLAELVPTPMSGKEALLHFLADPNISTLLLTLGGVALYVEFSSGFSMIIPGLVGVFLMVLGMISLQTLPISIGGAILLGLGFVLLVAEIFVASYGLLTLASVVCVILGALFLIDPSSAMLQVSWTLLAPLALGTFTVAGLIAYLLSKDKIGRAKLGSDEMLGRDGTVISINSDGQSGTALFGGEIWTIAAREPLVVGDIVRTEKRTGLSLLVQKK